MADQDPQEDYRRYVAERVQAMQKALARVTAGELEATVAGTSHLDPLDQLAARLDALVADLARLKVAEVRTETVHPPAGSPSTLPREQWLRAAGSQDSPPGGSAWRSAAAQAIATRQSVVYTNGGGGATLAVPLSFADELIGVLGFDGDDADRWSEYELAAVEAIAEQVGLALENQRLFQQTQDALAQTARQASRLGTLNQLAAALNATTTLDQIVAIIARYINDLVGSERASLTLFDQTSGNMTVFDLNTGREVSRLAGTFRLTNTALGHVLETRQLARFDALADSPFADNRRLADTGLRARMMAPLTTLTDVIGTISVSAAGGPFAAADETLLRQLAALLATTIENQRLTRATQERAVQLERLSTVESALSQAQTEDDIVRALARFSAGAEQVTLYYVETDGYDIPQRTVAQSHWYREQIATKLLPQRVIPIEQTPAARLWLERPNELLVVEDIFSDKRMDEAARDLGKALKVRSTIIMPLRSAGRWQAAVFFTWRNARTFSDDELFVLRRLLEPVGAVIARRRATLAQRRALAETELLYGLTAQLNAATEIDEVCRVIASYHSAARVLLFSAPGTGAAHGLQLTYQWRRPDIDGPLADVRLVNAAFAEALGWSAQPPAPQMFADAGGDERLNDRFRRYMDVFDIRSLVWLPLMVGRTWIGLLAVAWMDVRVFTAEDDRIYGSLMSQSAIVLNQLQLLRETETLYRTGRRINEAQQLDEMLTAVMEALDAPMLEKAAIWSVERAADGPVSSVIVLANWTNGTGVPPLPAGTRYPVEIVNAIREIVLPEPQFVPDIAADERLDPVTIAFLQQRSIQSLVLLPLLVANRQLGVIIMTGDHSGDFDERLVRVCSALAPQVAIAIENRTLLAQAQARARRERILREITGRIRSATSVDAIMRTAAREIGEALGKQTFVYLEAPPPDEQGIP